MNPALRRLIRGRAERLFRTRGGLWLACVREVIATLRHEGIS